MALRPPTKLQSPTHIYESTIRLMESVDCPVSLGVRIPWVIAAIAEYMDMITQLKFGADVMFDLPLLSGSVVQSLLITCNEATEAVTELYVQSQRGSSSPATGKQPFELLSACV